MITRYLESPSPIAIRYFREFYICTCVTNLNRSTVSELILEGTSSQPEVSLIQKLQKHLGNDLHFVDVGGNIGSFMWQFADKCADITVFEPIPRLNRVIEESIVFNQFRKVSLVKKALGDHPSTVKMLDNNNSSVVEGASDGITIDVPVSTLDMELKHKKRVDFIKIDVEGFELKVLRGGMETIKKHKPHLLIELHPSFIRNYGDDCQDVIDFMGQFNYKISYHSFLNERRLQRYQRIFNRWAGNPGKVLSGREEFIKDIVKKPELTSYHLYCEPE